MADRLLTRNASPRPATANDTARTVELTVATEADVGDGLILSCRQLPEYGPAPVPVLLSHQNATDAMAGRIRSLRIEQGQLIGLAEFTDAPAADEGWQLARSGCAVSVGASVPPDALKPHSATADLATRWRLREASLVPVGADPLAVTRSFQSNPMDNNNNAAPVVVTEVESDDDAQLTRAQLKRERDLLRLGKDAGLSAEQTDQLIRSGKTLQECSVEAVRLMRIRLEGGDRGERPAIAHPARVLGATGSVDPVQDAIERALSGKALEKPLPQVLRDAGYSGRTDADLVRNAFTGKRPENWLQRGFHSTSDAKDLLLATGDRRLQERFAEPQRGIFELARLRELADFRPVSVLDVGLVGTAQLINEGGELKYGTLSDSAGSYKANRYGLGLSLTFEALKNDDLGGLDQVLSEVGSTMLEREADALVELLTVDGDGAPTPDGLALFDEDHGNSTAATMSTEGLTDLIKLLRTQTSVGGRRLWLDPGYLLFGPELEATAMQLMSDAWAPEAPQDANPWKNLRLIIEPSITDTTFYLVASGPRKPLELGRVQGLPMMRESEDFDTSSLKLKTEHAFGCAAVDHRVIVRAEPSES